MEASIGKYVKQALSDVNTAKVLTAAVIGNAYNSNVIKINGALPGKVLTLKRVSLKDK